VRISSRWLLWRLPAAGAVAAAALFAIGFWYALRGSTGEPLGEPPPPAVTPHPIASPSGHRLLLVLGDSLARGTGDETGRGFAGDVHDTLARQGQVDLVNLAVNGAESEDVRQLADSANVRTLAASASWILLSAGGNDLSHAIPRAESPAEALGEVGEARRRFLSNLREILTALRGANPSSPICMIGLYDPFADAAAGARAGASVILSWRSAAEETALSFSNVTVVPTFDLFFQRPDRLSPDHFHPNRKGYAAIAARVGQVLSP
jgi:lysophospholipase L1-like esterase